jgi:DNA-nicking Smr family endonuclease
MGRRRRRTLTPDEAALWERVKRTAAPLRPAPASLLPRETAPESAPDTAPADRLPEPSVAAPPRPVAPAAPVRPRTPAPPSPPRAAVTLAPDPFEALASAPSRLDGRRAERLRRGKLEPEARLDLHGMTRERAHAALSGFVLSSQARGLRVVLVITGKGRADRSDAVIPERHGILRHSLPHWLAAPPLTGRVIEMRPAHARHGGAGAVYLYLRRRVG